MTTGRLIKEYPNLCKRIAVDYNNYLETKKFKEFHELGNSINELLRKEHKSYHFYSKTIAMPTINYVEFDSDTAGNYSPWYNTINIKKNLSEQEEKIALLHEIVHYVQKNIGYFMYNDDKKKEYYDRLEEREAYSISQIINYYNVV